MHANIFQEKMVKTRKIFSNSFQKRNACATKIQALCRGHLCRQHLLSKLLLDSNGGSNLPRRVYVPVSNSQRRSSDGISILTEITEDSVLITQTHDDVHPGFENKDNQGNSEPIRHPKRLISIESISSDEDETWSELKIINVESLSKSIQASMQQNAKHFEFSEKRKTSSQKETPPSLLCSPQSKTTKMRSRITYNPVSPFRRGQKAKALVRKSPTNSSNAIDKDAPVRLPQRKVSIDPELLYLD